MMTFAEREIEARNSLKWYGTKRQKPYKIHPEMWEQILFCGWMHKFFPEVWEVTFSTGNGLQSNPKTVNVYKSAGLKPGVPDLIILYPSRFYHGCLLEVKRLHGGKTTAVQIEMCERFRMQHYFTAICHGFPNAAKALLRYLYEYN